MSMQCKKKRMRKWVAALRSGEYAQGKGALRIDNKFCCMGVACEVAINNGVSLDVHSRRAVNSDGQSYSYDDRHGYLSDKVLEWLGLAEGNDDPIVGIDLDNADFTTGWIVASEANDTLEWDFAKIADSIEKLYEL